MLAAVLMKPQARVKLIGLQNIVLRSFEVDGPARNPHLAAVDL